MSAQRRIAYLDCSSGVSGDKLLGALLDVGSAEGSFTADHLRDVVAALSPEARVDVTRTRSHGISGTGLRVSAAGDSPHRGLAEIHAVLTSANLPERVAQAALLAFETLALAEARVHGVSPEAVHFHEVGAIDSIADIVGVCAGLDALDIEQLVAGPVAVGWGSTESAHGVLPVPAPATALLLAGVPITPGHAEGELTTPTGAVLLSTLASRFGPPPPMTVEHVGWGMGTREIGVPNVCQLLVGHPAENTARDAHPATGQPGQQPVVVLESNIDHLTAEELAYATEALRSMEPALDVWLTPILMKKGRAASTFSVLTDPASAGLLASAMMELTGTLGVRSVPAQRWCTEREIREVTTEWGVARVKIGAGRVRPEHDDVARIAREHSLSYAKVAEKIARLAGTESDAGS
jgi:uncharacterized protein (TIGR00299 family) protein